MNNTSETSSRLVLVDDPFVRIELEYTKEQAILHIAEVKVFNKTTLRHMQKLSDELCSFLLLHYDAVCTGADPERKDLERLAPLLGFTKLEGQFSGLNIYMRC